MPKMPLGVLMLSLSILCGPGVLSACSGEKKPAPTQPSVKPSSSSAGQVLDALSNQLDSLRDELERARQQQANAQASAKPSASPSPSPGASPAPSAVPNAPIPAVIVHPCQKTPRDADRDGLADSCEDALAETYAPIVFHSSEESNFPTNVEAFLPQTVLWFRDDDCDFKVRVLTAPTQAQMISQVYPASCSNRVPIYANSTRSRDKHRTFYLADVAEEARKGSPDAKDWITYVHAYPNVLNGATIQYWRFYAYNDAANDHGGDWEGVHIVLDSQFKPVRASLLGHTGITQVPWADLEVEGTHPHIFSEGGGHASLAEGDSIKADGCKGIGGFFSCRVSAEKPETHVRHETWKNGQVTWFSGETQTSGGLLNVGERSTPLNNQVFIQYAGLWGSPGRIFATSGYWGPAYNETGMLDNGFLTAWALGMLNPKREEAYPLSVSP